MSNSYDKDMYSEKDNSIINDIQDAIGLIIILIILFYFIW